MLSGATNCKKSYLEGQLAKKTRPKGARGQDTDQAGTFWGVLNVSPRASGAQLGYKLSHKKTTWNNEKPRKIDIKPRKIHKKMT